MTIAPGGIFPPRNLAMALFYRRVIAFRDIIPIHEIIDESLEIIGPAIAIVYVINVFSDIDGQNRLRSLDQRIFGIPRLRDGDLTILDHKPCPARTELGRASLHQFLLDLFYRSKRFNERFFEAAWNFATAIRLD